MKILPMPEIHIGANTLNEVSTILNKINASKVMVVTDQGIIKAGIYDKLKAILDAAGKTIILFDQVQPDPEIELVASVVKIARTAGADAMIGLGGGSSLDTAKVAAALVTNDKNIEAYIGLNLLEKDGLPIIAIPTTAGTGSEVTPIAILSDDKEQLKKGIVSNVIIPKFAILDPSLTVGLPPHVTAATGLDALTHAIEAYTSKNANSYSDLLALDAIKIISVNLRKAYENGGDLVARENMLMGSLLAGIAFANAGVAAVHAFAYPLGGIFHIPHGLANSLMLPTIMAYNMPVCEDKFTRIAQCFAADNQTAVCAIDEVNALCSDLRIPRNLAEMKILESDIQAMAEGAMKVTRLLVNNPREITLADAIDLYTKAYKK